MCTFDNIVGGIQKKEMDADIVKKFELRFWHFEVARFSKIAHIDWL